MPPELNAADVILAVFGGLLVVVSTIGWWLERHAPLRDEDEELRLPYRH